MSARVNLFIVGACKSGTSYLHDFLGKQNHIFASVPKEPYFFELEKEKRDPNEYWSTYFKDAAGTENYFLDSRHRNMFFHWIPEAIKDYNPHSKIIFILRNPIDRAYSHWWMWYSRKVLQKSFHKEVTSQIKKLESGEREMNRTPKEYSDYIKSNAYGGRIAYADANTIVESGYYFSQMERYYKIFPEEQLIVLDYNILKNTEELVGKLEGFLKVPILGHELDKVNTSKKYRKTSHYKAGFLPIFVKKYLKTKFYSKPSMKSKTRVMLKEHYKCENEKLKDKLNLDFVEMWEK